jgi:spoIIIJ-associated protein
MSREFEGKTLEEALEAAREALGHDLEESDYRVVEEKNFLGMARKIVISVGTVDEPAGQDEQDGAPEEEDVTVSEADQVEAMKLVEELAREIVSGTGLELDVDVTRGSGGILVDLSGADAGQLTSHHGELLASIQYLVQKIVARRYGPDLRLAVDAEGFRSQRDEELAGLARRTADAVRKSGRRALLPPLPPAERRKIHIALAEMDVPIDRDPTAHVFYDSHVPWVVLGDGLKRRGGPSGTDPLT